VPRSFTILRISFGPAGDALTVQGDPLPAEKGNAISPLLLRIV
jgi:hypothetical protein